MIGNILRFKTAVALVLLGLLTLLAGIGQKTFWAPAESFTATAPADAKAAPLTVFDQKLRTLHGGTVKINVKGEGSFLLAAGRPDDVNAWVDKTAHNTVSGVSDDGKALQLTHTDGEATAPSPAGSDLWVSAENASGELNYSWTAPADGDWSLLLAADGTKPAPASITMTFPNDTSTPWAVPFMMVGGLLILAGAALLVLKPGSGPGARVFAGARDSAGAPPAAAKPTDTTAAERNAPGRSTGRLRRPGVVGVIGVLTAAAVTGTGVAAQAGQTPSPSPSTSSTAAADKAPHAPVLLDAQFRRILEQVSGAVDAGDAAKDASKLQPRVGQTELEVRTQNYKIRSQVGSYGARMPVRATKLLTTVVTQQRSWPRSVLAVTQGEGNVVPQLLTLTQASPRENYKLVGTTPLQPGTTFPGIARGGIETLAPSAKSGLTYSGEEALAGLGDRLTSADSGFKDKLVEGASSPYIADTLAYQADAVSTGVNGTFSFTHKPVPENTVVFRTADGGALALGRLNFAFDGTPKAPGDKLTIGDDAAALAGGKETGTGMVLTFAESVAVYIPPTGSTDPMKLVAATRGLVGASFK
ncbi:hypothetical protein [Pseudarthrobacter sp. H2]|uniref:hypothetical protein n=1 Tax=Pseudarthrobacter sp. H2 TaxID=3418415 RepID=UPI003CF2E8EE